MNQLEDLVRDAFADRGAGVAGARFAEADVRRRAGRIRLRQRVARAAAGASTLALIAVAAVVVPPALRADRAVPAEFAHSDPAYVDWPARGNRSHDRKLLKTAVGLVEESGHGPYTRLRLLLAERIQARPDVSVEVVVFEGYDVLGRPRLMNVVRYNRGSHSVHERPAPAPADLTHQWSGIGTGPRRGMLLVSPLATRVEVAGTSYDAGSGVLDIPGELGESIDVWAGDTRLAHGVLGELRPDPGLPDAIDWPTRGMPAPKPVVQAGLRALRQQNGIAAPKERQLASGRLPDRRVFLVFTVAGEYSFSERTAWLWVGAPDGSAGELTEIPSYGEDNPHVLGWNLDGYALFVAQPGARSVEYSTDAGSTWAPAPNVDGLGVLDVRSVDITDAGEVKVRIVDFPGCATWTWTARQSGVGGQFCDRYARAYER